MLLLETYDLTEILKECQRYASIGYKIASAQYKNLNGTLSNAASKINETLMDFNTSPCYVSSATDLLSQQLVDIESAFSGLSFAFKEDLENLRENLSKFSVTLFGRTMAGKSTLMEILTNGDGLSIGNGAQRTTRDVRQYNWNGLEITDVPGIGAFEGEDDEQIAFEAAKKADLILFLITDDGPQAPEAECFGRIMNLGKPVICIMNVKASAPEGKSIKLLTRDIEKKFDMERLNKIRKQFMSYSKQLGQDWGHVPFVYVHLKSAFMSQNSEDPQVKDILHKASRIDFLKREIVEQVREKGCFYRTKTFIDIITNPMLVSMENLLNQSLLNSAQGRIVLSKKRQLAVWKNGFAAAGKNRVRSLLINMKSQLNGEIAAFAEEHFDDKNADKAWNRLLQENGIQDNCQSLLSELEEICNDKIKEVSREIAQELRFSTSFSGDRTLRMNRIIDGKKLWDWSATIIGGGLSISAIVASAFDSEVKDETEFQVALSQQNCTSITLGDYFVFNNYPTIKIDRDMTINLVDYNLYGALFQIADGVTLTIKGDGNFKQCDFEFAGSNAKLNLSTSFSATQNDGSTFLKGLTDLSQIEVADGYELCVGDNIVTSLTQLENATELQVREKMADFVGAFLTVKGDIGVNICVKEGADVSADDSLGLKEADAGVYGPSGTDVYTYHCSPAELSNEQTITVNGVGYTVNGMDLINAIADNAKGYYSDEEKLVASSLGDYANAAKAYFDGSNVSFTGDASKLGGMLSDYVVETTDTDEVEYAGVSLLFKNNITMRYYVELADAWDNYSYSSMPSTKGDYYYFDYADIPLMMLDSEWNDSITSNNSGSDFSIKWSPLAYLNLAVNKNSDTNLKNLALNLYTFYLSVTDPAALAGGSEDPGTGGSEDPSTGGSTSGGSTSGGATSGGATSGGASSGGATSGGASSGGNGSISG